MQLNKIAIHKISKEPNQSECEVMLSEGLLPRDNEVVLEFASSLSKAYFHKKSRFYTQFKAEHIEPQFKSNFDDYLREVVDFFEFTTNATFILKEEMLRKPQSKGGILVTMHYTSSNNNEYLFIALLDNKQDFSINDTLDLVKQITLNIEHMAMASVINITKYQADRHNYLTFLRGLRNIPDYFMDFIGADSSRNKEIAQITKDWVKAINDFFDAKEYPQDTVEEKANILLSNIKTLHKHQEIITAQTIANAIYPEDPDEFIEFVYNEESDYELPSEMEKMDTSVINTIKIFSYNNKQKSFSLKFKRVDIDRMITINEDSITITDREIVEDIRRKIDDEDE